MTADKKHFRTRSDADISFTPPHGPAARLPGNTLPPAFRRALAGTAPNDVDASLPARPARELAGREKMKKSARRHDVAPRSAITGPRSGHK